MAKFHINKHGVPAPCKAKPGNCPLGGDEQHYNSQEEAQEAADAVNESKHGLLPTVKRRARAEFRVSESKWGEYKDKYVEVDYDDSSFSGKVIDTYYKDEEDSGLIIQSQDGEIKHIKNYRMEDVLVTAESEDGYKKQLAQVNNFHDKMAEDFENDFVDTTNDAHLEFEIYELGEDEVNPDSLVDNYFEAVIDREEKGYSVNEEEFDHDFINDIEKNKDMYIMNYGGGDERWSEESDENFEYDLDVAEKVQDYYEEQRAYIDHVVDKAHQEDWTKHGKSQRQGVVDALKEVYKGEYYK